MVRRLAVLGWALLSVWVCGSGCRQQKADAPTPANPPAVATSTIILTVTGMTCEGCVGHVQQALAEIPGVATAKVDLAQSQAVVSYDAARVQPEALIAAVVKAGYQASVAPLAHGSATGNGVPLPAAPAATPTAQ